MAIQALYTSPEASKEEFRAFFYWKCHQNVPYYIYRAVALCETALLLKKYQYMRNFKFQNNQFYHIYNRGVEKRDVFCDDKDFGRFLQGMRDFNDVMTKEARSSKPGFASKPDFELLASTPLVDIICYNLLLNHFHMCLKQLKIRGFPHLCTDSAWATPNTST